MRIGSLFSGIGGLELGLERAGVGHTVWQVEIDPFCRKVLARQWPGAERFENVTKFQGRPADLICGGFPCQDISSAGKGAGLAGSRSGLWFEFARIIGLVRPAWVVVENVASGANRWVDAVCAGLERLSYEVLPIPLSAQDVGALHLRRRIFVVGHAVSGELRKQPGRRGGESRKRQAEPGDPGPTETATNSSGDRREAERERAETIHDYWGRELRHGIETGRIPSPYIRGMVNGIPNRLDRLRALGNSVVPQVAEVIGHVINELGIT